MKTNAEILCEYVRRFSETDDLMYSDVPDELRAVVDDFGVDRWRPSFHPTPRAALDALYTELNCIFPPLFEDLVLSFRWHTADMGRYVLLANHPAADLTPLMLEIRADRHLFTTLIAYGFVPFAKGAGGSYDPVCFDFKKRKRNGEMRVVRVDHEEILCHDRIGDVEELAGTFPELINV